MTELRIKKQRAFLKVSDKKLSAVIAKRPRFRDGAPVDTPAQRMEAGHCSACGGDLVHELVKDGTAEVACNLCFLEFVVIIDDGKLALGEHKGRLSKERAADFGITPERWEEYQGWLKKGLI